MQTEKEQTQTWSGAIWNEYKYIEAVTVVHIEIEL